jgi:membrane-bound lytic murein transglycosylase B
MKYIFILLLLTATLFSKDYTKEPAVQDFIDEMVTKENFKFTYLEALFKDVNVQKTPLRFFTRKKRKPTPEEIKRYPLHGAWDRYVRLKVTPKRIKEGAAFISKYKTAFALAEQRYGVPKEYIAAIIGIESVYGKNTGKFPVFDTLSTLAFEPNRRNRFFKSELKKFIQLCYDNRIDPKAVKGSFAGAIGLCQFMPSSYKAYGVDHNGDGRVSMLHPADAIASVANYLSKNGWRRGEPVATRVSYEGNRFRAYKTGYNRTYFRHRLKGIKPKQKWNYYDKVRLIKLDRQNYDELWYGAKNFYVITRYNHSAYYAMSVHQLAEGIKAFRKNGTIHLSQR